MTISEQLFDNYLRRRKVEFEIEQGVEVHPDRILHLHNKEVICEIRQLERDKTEPVNFSGWSDPYSRIRRAIKKKVRQGKEAKNSKIPYVIVLFSNTARVATDNFIIQAAMYGDLSILIDVDLQNPKSKAKVRDNVFSGRGIIRHARNYKEPGQPFNRRISAVAVLETINPTYKYVSKASDEIIKGTEDLKERLHIFWDVIENLKKEGKYIEDLAIEKVRVFHNFYAYNPLGFDIFNGKYDEQYFIDPTNGRSRRYKDR